MESFRVACISLPSSPHRPRALMPSICNCSVSRELTLPFTAIRKISSVFRSVYRDVYPEGDVIIFGGVPSASPSELASAEPPWTKTSLVPCFHNSTALLQIAEKSMPSVPPSFTTVIS
jgi:hypothetical protein